jgi:hypothetical protein
VYACSTMNARPYLLAAPPKGTTPDPALPGAPPPPTEERGTPPPGTNESREGMLLLPSKSRADALAAR